MSANSCPLQQLEEAYSINVLYQYTNACSRQATSPHALELWMLVNDFATVSPGAVLKHFI